MGMEHPQVFYTYEWAAAVARAYKDSLSSLIFLAYQDKADRDPGDQEQALAGAVALAEKPNGEIVFLTGTTADYCDFLSGSKTRGEFIAAVFSELKGRGAAKIVLANLPADSQSVGAISQAAAAFRYRLHSRLAYLCAQVIVGNDSERASLKESVVTKRKLRRNMRELEKRGPVRVDHECNWSPIEPLLDPFSRAHIARFLETGRISNLVRPERRAFLRELARELSCTEWIAISRLLVGETVAAWNYGFRCAGSWFWYQPTVNSSFEEFSPGYCLLSKIIEAACDRKDIDLVDLGLGAEDYKERFATANRGTLYCELNIGSLDHARAVVRYRAASLVKSSPWVEDLTRTLLSRLGRLSCRLRKMGIAGFSAWLERRIWTSLIAFDDVLFFQAEAPDRSPSNITLRQLDPDLLGSAAIAYANDPDTLNYLSRSSVELRKQTARGFAVYTAEELPVHFCWVKDFDGFEMAELRRTLEAPCKDAVMIFDCFTPSSARGSGFFAHAITLLAARLRSEGKVPWIFSAATNQASLRGIEKAGFAFKYSLWHKRILFLYETQGSTPSADVQGAGSALVR